MKTPASPIPTPALLQHIGIVGKTGSGKTFTAKGIVEQLLDQERRVCILDPTGAWWGLKSSANGKDAGYPVVVFGGEHADVPISEHAGEALGKLIAEGNVPSVIDLSEMGEGERRRFAASFFEALYRHNKGPLHLIVDEADEFAPQSGAPGTEVMLGRIDRIVRRGRIKGFRVVMISQRPAVLNKNVFTQCETLIAMRLPSSQDRKAIELWIKGQGDESQAKEMMGSLASLKRGEGWVWAPAQGLLQRVHFPAIKTFDSSRTPEDGEQIAAPKRLADVDLSGISAAMAAAIEESKANDPALLRKEIAELTRKLRDQQATPVRIDAGELGKAQEDIARLRNLLELEQRQFRDSGAVTLHKVECIRTYIQEIEDVVRGHEQASEKRRSQVPQTKPVTHVVKVPRDVQGNAARHAPAASGAPGRGGNRASAAGTTEGTLNAAQQRILDALAWLKSIDVKVPSVPQAALLAGMNHGGGYFNNTLGSLSTRGLVLRRNGSLELTDAGDALAARPEGVLSLADFHAQVRSVIDKLKGGLTVRILDALIKHGPREISIGVVAEAVGASVDGGYFNNSIGPLGTLGLIRRERGVVRPTEILFPPQLS